MAYGRSLCQSQAYHHSKGNKISKVLITVPGTYTRSKIQFLPLPPLGVMLQFQGYFNSISLLRGAKQTQRLNLFQITSFQKITRMCPINYKVQYKHLSLQHLLQNNTGLHFVIRPTCPGGSPGQSQHSISEHSCQTKKKMLQFLPLLKHTRFQYICTSLYHDHLKGVGEGGVQARL